MSNSFVSRSSKLGLVLSLTLVFGIVFGALPALASAASTASVTIHNVLADQAGKAFTIRVNNTEPAGTLGTIGVGKTINEVRVRGPVDLIDAVLPGTSGPTAFSDIQVIGSPPVEIRFQVPVGQTGGIAPGANATFTVVGDVRDTLTRDRSDVWRVRVSSDRGLNHTAASGANEALLTNVRVLQVQSVQVVAPTGAADDRDGDGKPEVTATQSNVCVRSTVANFASIALNVTPGLTGGGFTVGNPRLAAQPPCSSPEVASASIPSSGSQAFDFLISANNVGSTASELVGTASAPNSSTPATGPEDDVLQAKQAIQIEPKADLTYVTNTLSPRAVQPGALGQVFQIAINKGPAASPPIPALSGQFESAFCNANLDTPTSLPGGTANNQTARFAACNVEPIPDGRYQPTVKYSYTDGNGLLQPLVDISEGTKADLEKIRLDSLIPDILNLKINAPASQITPPPTTEPAVTNGTAFTADGDVVDTSPETGEPTPCGPGNAPGSTAPLPCTRESAFMVQYPLTALQGGGTPFARKIDVTSSCPLSSTGRLTCNITLSGTGAALNKFDTGVFSTALEVTVKDETGNVVTDLSPLVDVDIIAPEIVSAETKRGGTVMIGGQQVPGQRRTIEVKFNEAVEAETSTPQDWIVQDGSTKTVCNVSQSTDKQTVTLTTCQELHADTVGTVDYNPRAPISQPYHDRVGKDIAVPATETLEDGIAPLAPVFATVEGMAVQDDAPNGMKFFFNTTTPTVRLEQAAPASTEDPSIAAGYIVEVWEESDGVDGLSRELTGDNQVCGDLSTGQNVDHDEDPTTPPLFFIEMACDFSGLDRDSKVYGLSIDGNDNVGLSVISQFVLDRVRPQIGSVIVTASPSDITVDFTERVPRGEDASGNWTYLAERPNDEGRTSPDIQDVRAGATASQRVLDYADAPYDPATLTPDELRYHFSAGSRYEDRAGNELLDINFVL